MTVSNPSSRRVPVDCPRCGYGPVTLDSNKLRKKCPACYLCLSQELATGDHRTAVGACRIADETVMTGSDLHGRRHGTWGQAKADAARHRVEWTRRAGEIERRLAQEGVPAIERDNLETELESLRVVMELDSRPL